jgi:hypothetical protein
VSLEALALRVEHEGQPFVNADQEGEAELPHQLVQQGVVLHAEVIGQVHAFEGRA